MPRARISEAGEDVVLPKTRARKPRAVSMDDVAPSVRKRAAPRARVAVATATTEDVSRKAPTPLAARRRSHSKNTKVFFVVLFICVLVAGLGIGIGFMDKGTIDVVAVVNERNEKINKGEVRDESGNAITQTIQVQSDTRPNGGLPMGDAPAPTPVPEVSSSTEATTTPEQVASSTDRVQSPATSTESSI